MVELQMLEDTVEMIRQKMDHRTLHLLGGLHTLVEHTNVSRDIDAGLKAHFGPCYFETRISKTTKINKANCVWTLRAVHFFRGASVPIFSMVPRNDLLSDRAENGAYCLAEVGRQYVVYFPAEGSVTIELPGATRELKTRWLSLDS